MLRLEPGAFCMLGKCSTREPQPQPRFLFENNHPGTMWKIGYEKRQEGVMPMGRLWQQSPRET